ncbi:MAG: family 4 glycosyl hydrolase, partial [Planctomycetota bacterium]
MEYRIAMIGAGSFFTDGITEGLVQSPHFAGTTFVLVDINRQALALSVARQKKIVKAHGAEIKIESTTNRRKALEGCHHVVTSCEKARVPYWIQDIEIPARYGVDHPMGENG